MIYKLFSFSPNIPRGLKARGKQETVFNSQLKTVQRDINLLAITNMPAVYSLPPPIQDIGYGVQFVSQNNITSKTLVCFVDGNGVLRYGFAYKNGSNLRVVSWEDEQRHNRTIPSGQSIFAFPELVTQKEFGNKNFNAADFNFPPFTPVAQQQIQQELMAYNNNQKIEDDNFVKQMAGLNISPLSISKSTDSPKSTF